MENKFKMAMKKIEKIFFDAEKVDEEVVEEKKFASSLLEDGETSIYYEELVVDGIVYSDEEMTIVLEDGDYILEDGRTIKVLEGKISEIVDVEEVEPEVIEDEVDLAKVKMAKVTAIDKWDIEVDQDTFEVGTLLTTTWENEEPQMLNDGEYFLEDGRKIQVDSDGKVVLVEEAKEVLSKMSLLIDKLEGEIDTLTNEKSEFTKEKKSFDSKVKELKSELKDLYDESVDPIDSVSSEEMEDEKMTVGQKRAAMVAEMRNAQ